MINSNLGVYLPTAGGLVLLALAFYQFDLVVLLNDEVTFFLKSLSCNNEIGDAIPYTLNLFLFFIALASFSFYYSIIAI